MRSALLKNLPDCRVLLLSRWNQTGVYVCIPFQLSPAPAVEDVIFGLEALCCALLLRASVGRYPLIAFSRIWSVFCFLSANLNTFSFFAKKRYCQASRSLQVSLHFSLCVFNEARVYRPWYVCSRGPFPLFLPSPPCSLVFPFSALPCTHSADAARVPKSPSPSSGQHTYAPRARAAVLPVACPEDFGAAACMS
jgi:hypothetical protein